MATFTRSALQKRRATQLYQGTVAHGIALRAARALVERGVDVRLAQVAQLASGTNNSGSGDSVRKAAGLAPSFMSSGTKDVWSMLSNDNGTSLLPVAT